MHTLRNRAVLNADSPLVTVYNSIDKPLRKIYYNHNL